MANQASMAVFPTADGAINPEVHRFSYERAGATVVEVEGSSHAVMLSHPEVVPHHQERDQSRFPSTRRSNATSREEVAGSCRFRRV